MRSLNTLSQHPEFWVILSLSLVVAPHLTRFPGWAIVFLSVMFLWRLLCINNTRWLAPKWLLIILTIFTSAGIFVYFGTLFGQTAGTVLLCILLGIKLHESQTRRDFMLLISLSFFIIVTNFLFSQSIPTVIYMLAIVIVLIMSMISINQNDASLTTNDKLKLSIKMLAQAIPLMLIMFVLFPRISSPLWELPENQQTAVTGLSDSMSPGNISNLIQSSAPAFRVEFKGQIPQQHQLYWRTLVLWYFDGQTWEKGNQNASSMATLSSASDFIDYTVTLEPHQKNWLFALDMPVEVPEKINYTNNFVLRAKQNINNLYQYKIKTALNYKIQEKTSYWENIAGLKIPENTNPETIRLGKKISQEIKDPEKIVNHVLNMFNQQNFHYTLNPPLTPGFNPVDQFLFKTKRGFCEHYASSFTLLMRSAGIPARVILGYQGGTVNPLNNVMTVRQSDAHAWSEVWIKNRGWVRIDPTAAIAPQRIERNLNAALDENESRPLHMRINSGIIKDILFYWDAADNQWNQWIVGYDTKMQQKLLESILKQQLAFSDLVLIMISSFAIVFTIISILIMRPWYRKKIDPVTEIYDQFCKKLSKQGINRELYEGPNDFAERVISTLPDQKASIQLITRLYIRLRYQATHNKKQFEQFKLHTKKFKIDTKL